MGFLSRNIENWTSVIKNTADGNLLVCKYPEENFNTGSTLIVDPGEEAVFIKNGRIEQIFKNGTYNLTTENYPFISDWRDSFSGGKSSFTCSIYFVRKSHSLEIKWGTDSPIQLRDPVLKIATSIRARGAYKIQIVNGAEFLLKLLGNNINIFNQESLNNYFINEFQQHIKSCLAETIISLNKEIIGINAEQNNIAHKIQSELQKILELYGLKLITFSIAGIDIPEDDPNRQKLEEAFANKQVINILGEDWGRQQSTEIIHTAAANENGIAGLGAGLGMGFAAGNVMGDMSRELVKQPLETKVCPICKSPNKLNAKFCSECGTSFVSAKVCEKCGHPLEPNTKFCDNCGEKQE